MFGKKKPMLLVCSVIISSVFIFGACSNSENNSLKGFELKGEAQGTTYTVIVAEESIDFTKEDIGKLLLDFDNVLSTYNPTSNLTLLNASEIDYAFLDKNNYFKNCYELSRSVYNVSDANFDPSVFPLVKGWGFFKKMETPLDQKQIDSLLSFVSFQENELHSIKFKNDSVVVVKKDPRFKLDFNAIAQGYSVDVLAEFIESRGCKNYYIEIGGELRLKGKNREGKNWKIGIDTPKELNNGGENREITGILNISNKSIATSGNYRNFYEVDGKKYSHTLNPKTGYPVQHNLLSATVIANNCGIADAFATVFMVVGLEESKKILANNSFDLDAVLIYQGVNGKLEYFTTPKAKSYFSE